MDSYIRSGISSKIGKTVKLGTYLRFSPLADSPVLSVLISCHPHRLADSIAERIFEISVSSAQGEKPLAVSSDSSRK
jgi:hypothetical protein